MNESKQIIIPGGMVGFGEWEGWSKFYVQALRHDDGFEEVWISTRPDGLSMSMDAATGRWIAEQLLADWGPLPHWERDPPVPREATMFFFEDAVPVTLCIRGERDVDYEYIAVSASPGPDFTWWSKRAWRALGRALIAALDALGPLPAR